MVGDSDEDDLVESILSDTSSGGVGVVDDLLEGSAWAAVKQDEPGDCKKAWRAWLKEWCDVLWAQMGTGKEHHSALAEVEAPMEEPLGLGVDYFGVDKNEALLEEGGQESVLAGEVVELEVEPAYGDVGTQTNGVWAISRMTVELVLQHNAVDGGLTSASFSYTTARP